ARAVGEAVALEEAEVETAGEGAPEDGVHHEEREVVRVMALDADVADADLGLHGAGSVHDVDGGLVDRALDLEFGGGRRGPRPVAEVEAREPLGLVDVD